MVNQQRSCKQYHQDRQTICTDRVVWVLAIESFARVISAGVVLASSVGCRIKASVARRRTMAPVDFVAGPTTGNGMMALARVCETMACRLDWAASVNAQRLDS